MARILSDLSTDLAALVEYGGPHVVRIEARRRLPGSGIVWSADGVIVTAHHVVERDDRIGVGLADGRTVQAALVGRDPSTDLAVLRAEVRDLAPATWIGVDNLRVGHFVVALARPGRLTRAALGIVSALGEGWRTAAGGALDHYLQPDVAMYPGFSGGPLLDVDGRVLGLNTTGLMWGGLSLTVPAATLERVVTQLLAHGRLRRGYLGVTAQPVRLPAVASRLVGSAQADVGLLVLSVEPDSPAERAGLLLGDTLISLDGQAVRGTDDLLGLLSEERIGAPLRAVVLRGGAVLEVSVTPGDRE
jgi:S1-C subfamily serine protease